MAHDLPSRIYGQGDAGWQPTERTDVDHASFRRPKKAMGSGRKYDRSLIIRTDDLIAVVQGCRLTG